MMTDIVETIYNCETGEVTYVTTNPESASIAAIHQASLEEAQERIAQEEAAKAEIKASATAKLAALGLTAEEIAALSK
jgi:hypothetical protein